MGYNRETLGNMIVGFLSAIVAISLGFFIDDWQWWAIFAACFFSGLSRKEIG